MKLHVMKPWWLWGLLALAAGAVLAATSAKKSPPPKPKLAVSIQPQHVADSLRAVISGHRENYVRLAAARVDAGAHWNDAQGWPAPCLMTRQDSEAAASKGVEFSFVLRSLQPAAVRNAVETEFERKALETLARRPEQPVYGEELLGGRWYFTAAYAETAWHPSCVACHNQLPQSPRRDYRTNDVLGALVIRVALEL
jgi:hypothetical protein